MKRNYKPIHDMNTPAHTSPQSNPRVYVLHPFPPVAPPAPPAPQPALPAPQPLPKPVLHPDRPTLKLGLDVHLEFIMAVAQRDHASPLAPRKFTPAPFRPQATPFADRWSLLRPGVFPLARLCGPVRKRIQSLPSGFGVAGVGGIGARRKHFPQGTDSGAGP